MKPHRKVIGLAFSIFISLIFITIFPSLEGIEGRFQKAFYLLRGKEKPFKNIVIIEIDKKTTRSQIGTLLKTLKDASCIGLMMPLQEASSFEDDLAFLISLKASRNVYLGVDFFIPYLAEEGQFSILTLPTKLTDFSLKSIPEGIIPSKAIGVNPPLPLFLSVISGIGHLNLLPDVNGMVSQIPLIIDYGGNLYPSLSLSLASSYLKRSPDYLLRSYLSKGKILINFGGGKFISYSIIDVLANKINKNIFSDKIVLVGIAPRENRLQTPYGFTNSLYLIAEGVDNILKGNSILPVPFKIEALLLILFGFLSGWISLSNPTKIAGLTTFILCLSFFVFSFSLFYWGIWLNTSSIIFVILLVFIVCSGYKIFIEKREREMARSMFGRYITPSIIDEVLKDEKFFKRVRRKELTVAFADMSNFSLLTETLEPKTLVFFLNEYFEEMSRIILDLGGEIDKFMGDEILFLFNGICEVADHAEKAALASIMMQKRLFELNKRWSLYKIPNISMKIGISTGSVIIGNIGSSLRTDWTVLGKEVNFAKKLQMYCAEDEIIISERTYSLISCGIKAEPFKVKIKEDEPSILVYKISPSLVS